MIEINAVTISAGMFIIGVLCTMISGGLFVAMMEVESKAAYTLCIFLACVFFLLAVMCTNGGMLYALFHVPEFLGTLKGN